MSNHDFIILKVKICSRGLGKEVHLKNMIFLYCCNWSHVVSE